MESYELEKWNWTEQDFELMGWHDCLIYAMKFDDQIVFDLDYILKWNQPEIEGMSFTFWISPTTLTFNEVTLFKADFEMDFVNGLEIADISKETTSNSTQWNIDTRQGTMVVHAASFEQVIRRKPSLQFGQRIQSYERGNISFSTTSDKNFELENSAEYRRKEEFTNYERAKELNVLRTEFQTLNKKTEAIVTKEFLTKKRILVRQIAELTELLDDTSFKGW